MNGMELYLLGCRFPASVIPAGLRVDVPKVTYDDKLGWIGEFWYFVSGSPIPRMYAKLHLPEGTVLEIKKLTEEAEFSQAESNPDLTQDQSEYLEQCVQLMGDFSTPPKSRYELCPVWMQTHTELQKKWFMFQPVHPAQVTNQGTAPPQWLVEYWTADRVREAMAEEEGAEEERLLPTDNGRELWHLAKEWESILSCIPKELEPGLPRLSYSKAYGWIAEYWYYYANAAVGLMSFPQPKYYLRIGLTEDRILEVRNLTGELQFQKSWLDVWAAWMYEAELDYLARCEQLMDKPNPSEAEIVRLQGLWLEAHPEDYARLLTNSSGMSETVSRWILSPDRTPSKNILPLIWFGEMHKGMQFGNPDIAEQCLKAVVDYGLNNVMKRRYEL